MKSNKQNLEIDVGVLHLMHLLFGDMESSQQFQQDNLAHGFSLHLFCVQPPEIDSIEHICDILNYSRRNGYKATVNILAPEGWNVYNITQYANVLMNIRISFSKEFLERHKVRLESDTKYGMFDRYEYDKDRLNILISQPLKKAFKAFGDVAQKFLLPQLRDYPKAFPTK